MRETSVVEFLLGRLDGRELNREVLQSARHISEVRTELHVEDMNNDFVISRSMAIELCNSALQGRLSPAALRLVAFVTIASDRFSWADEVTGEVLHDWSAPEVNLGITRENLLLSRSWLEGNVPYPGHAAPAARSVAGRLVSELVKVPMPGSNRSGNASEA